LRNYKERVTPQKIVFLDIDGTLMGADGIVPPSALTACREARRQGHLLYICSGRPRSIISDAVLAIGFDGIISSGGARIETGGAVIFDTVMPAETVKQITAYLHNLQCGFSFETNNSVLSNRYFLNHWETLKRNFAGMPQANVVDDLLSRMSKDVLPEDPSDFSYVGVNKIVFVGSPGVSFEALSKTFAGVCELFHGSIPFSGKEGGEIGPLGVHKGSAVKRIAEHYGIPLADTIAFGDSDNDRTMIEAVGIGIAMGNADDALKEIADDVTASLKEDGLFKGFKKYGLI
jgi:Cof subfamily protein (haloacid dehalogenase superfamily)